MTAQYLILAVVLAFTLNHANPFVRAGGTLLAAVGLAFIVLSIVLADLDGTFAALPAGLGAARPLLLNAQAVIASAAVLFLLWAAWRQVRHSMQCAATRVRLADHIAEAAILEAVRTRTLANLTMPELESLRPSSASPTPGCLPPCRPPLETGRIAAWLQGAVAALQRRAP